MSRRFLLATLPALLAPLGIEGEALRPDRQALAEAEGVGSVWSERASRGSASLGTRTRGAPELDGPPDLDRPAASFRRTFTGAVVDVRPTGLASPGTGCRMHLTHCGHSADRLDLPPPPRG